MSDFVWHEMESEWPAEGRGNYLVLGPKGGVYLAKKFTGYDSTYWFKDMNGNHHYTHEVVAWAVVPPYGEQKLEARSE